MSTTTSTTISIASMMISDQKCGELEILYNYVITDYLEKDFVILRENVGSFQNCNGCGHFNYDGDFYQVSHRHLHKFGFYLEEDKHFVCAQCVNDRRLNCLE